MPPLRIIAGGAHTPVTASTLAHQFGKIVFKEQGDRIIGACFEVYKEKENGFLEAVNQECLARELAE